MKNKDESEGERGIRNSPDTATQVPFAAILENFAVERKVRAKKRMQNGFVVASGLELYRTSGGGVNSIIRRALNAIRISSRPPLTTAMASRPTVSVHAASGGATL